MSILFNSERLSPFDTGGWRNPNWKMALWFETSPPKNGIGKLQRRAENPCSTANHINYLLFQFPIRNSTVVAVSARTA